MNFKYSTLGFDKIYVINLKRRKDRKERLIEENPELDFTFIDDLVDGCWLAAKSKKGINETFNITFGKARTLYDYVQILKKHFKDLKFQVLERDKKRPKRGTLKIDKAKKLRVISKWGTGIDSIDKNYAIKNNIKVFNTPGAFTDAVAEHALGLMFL